MGKPAETTPPAEIHLPSSVGLPAKPMVLGIDDEEGPRASLYWSIKDIADVNLAENVDRGLALLAVSKYDVVVLDIRMPGRDGLEGLELIRKHDPFISVIIATSYTDNEPTKTALRLGAADYINKPFKIGQMRAAVMREAQRSRRRRNEAAFYAQMEGKLAALTARVAALQANTESPGASRDRDSGGVNAAYMRVASDLLHDLNNPLTVAVGFTQVLLHEMKSLESPPPGFDRIMDQLQIIDRASTDCAELIQSWRSINREHAAPTPFDLRELIVSLQNTVFQHAPGVFVEEGPETTVLGVPIECRRIFQNLIGNALEAGATDVRVALHVAGGKVEVVVRDNGPGIPEHLKARLLRQNVKSTKPTGTGQGLRIVGHLVELQDGTITFDSTPAGTSFRLQLPSAPAAPR